MSQVNGIGTAPALETVGKDIKGKEGGSSLDSSFSNMVEKGIERLNSQMLKADAQAARLAAGKELDVPDVMLSITKADISFRMFVQMRNKALSAYEEIMRLQF